MVDNVGVSRTDDVLGITVDVGNSRVVDTGGLSRNDFGLGIVISRMMGIVAITVRSDRKK